VGHFRVEINTLHLRSSRRSHTEGVIWIGAKDNPYPGTQRRLTLPECSATGRLLDDTKDSPVVALPHPICHPATDRSYSQKQPLACTPARTATGRKYAIVMTPQSCPSVPATNQPATAFGGIREMALPARSSQPSIEFWRLLPTRKQPCIYIASAIKSMLDSRASIALQQSLCARCSDPPNKVTHRV
jgi:hypothetical protein